MSWTAYSSRSSQDCVWYSVLVLYTNLNQIFVRRSRCRMVRLVLALACASVAAAIFPESGIANYGGKLTAATADKFVQENVDAGRTVFIRFIASEG